MEPERRASHANYDVRMSVQALQDRYAAADGCYGCGPANEKGLRIKSFVEGDECVARFQPAPHHQAFPGMLNGGIIGTLLDCHCNWTAAHHLMQQLGVDRVPCTVTAEYAIKLRRPTPLDTRLTIRARVVESTGRRATVEGTLEAGGQVTATCRGLFVAVEPGHPAYHEYR